MKKLIALMAAFALSALAMAEGESNVQPAADDDNILFFSGFGIMAPYFRVHADGDGSRNLAGVLICNRNTTVDKEFGLTLKLDFGVGGLWIDTLPYTKSDDKIGASFSVELGAGHAFARTEDTVFAVCANIALLDYFFSDSSDFIYSNGETSERLSDANINAILCGLGGDMQFIKRLGGNTYFFADVGAYYLLGMETCEYASKHSDATCGVFTKRAVYGTVAVTPSLGLLWRY